MGEPGEPRQRGSPAFSTLAGGPLAALNGGPILLVTRDTIPSATAAELSRLGPDEIVILGGTGVVSSTVHSDLGMYTASVTRLAGSDRFATAAAIAGQIPGAGVLYVATASNFPDALAGSAVAGSNGSPIILVRSSDIPGPSLSTLEAKTGLNCLPFLLKSPVQWIFGSGDDVKSLSLAHSEVAAVELSHSGLSSFIVWMKGPVTDLMVNEIGNYSGSTLTELAGAGSYFLDITADGHWTGRVYQPTPGVTGYPLPPLDAAGAGDSIVAVRITNSGLYRFTASHNGSSNFITWIYRIDSSGRDLIFNKIGAFSGSTSETLSPGYYIIAINADGSWTMQLSKL